MNAQYAIRDKGTPYAHLQIVTMPNTPALWRMNPTSTYPYFNFISLNSPTQKAV